MTKKILIPVDFSEHSHKAIQYACMLNNMRHHEFDLLHVFADSKSIREDSRTSARGNMQDIISRLVASDSSRNVNVIFKEGNLYHEIKNVCDESQYDAIVMGTKGASGLDALLTSSNMYDVLVNTTVPVLAVPLHYKNKEINKVGLLCNFKDGELEVLQQADKLLGKDYELVLIHINADSEDIKKIDEKFQKFINRIIEATGIDDISYIVKDQSFFIQYKENIAQSIESVLRDEQIDTLLVTKSRKSFFRKIIEENIVRKLALQISIPTLFAKV
jgi:nucleotide-binding universal stress UspA family protein